MEEPELKVVKGEPSTEELAAVAAAVTGKLRQGGTGDTIGRSPSRQGWAAYWRSVRQPMQPGPNAWRRSGLPG